MLNRLIIGKKHRLPVPGTVSSSTHHSYSNTAEVRGPGPLSKQCGQHELHTHLSPVVNRWHRLRMKWISSTKEAGRSVDYFWISKGSTVRDLLSLWSNLSLPITKLHLQLLTERAYQSRTRRGEEHIVRTKAKHHGHGHTNRAQKSHEEMRGMVRCQLEGHL